VQTPTLAIVVEREKKIKRFVSRDYWEVKAEFAAAAGGYEAAGSTPNSSAMRTIPSAGKAVCGTSRRPRPLPGQPRQAWHGYRGVKPSSQLSPMLFDLTSLQREANARFGFSAKTTLSIAQELYERHKVLTYPRTGSRHLPKTIRHPETDVGGVSDQKAYQNSRARSSKRLGAPHKRIFDNTKITDHFAIIPTTQEPRALTKFSRKSMIW